MKRERFILLTVVALLFLGLGYGQTQEQRRLEKATAQEKEEAKIANNKWDVSIKPLKGVNEWDFYVESGKDDTVTRILGRKEAKPDEYILRLWVEAMNRQNNNASIRLKDISLQYGNDTATPFAYAEPGAVAVVPSRDISLKVPPAQKQ